MKLRTKYLLFVAILHGAALVLSFAVFRDNKVLFIVSELAILISIFLSWQLYKALIRPLQTMLRGSEAIRDCDFNTKFVLTGTYEMDELIGVYNRMMDQLRLERTKGEEQHLFLAKLIESSPTGIIILDHDGYIRQLNPKVLAMPGLGDSDISGLRPAEIDHPVMQEVDRLPVGASGTVTINGVNTYKLSKSHFIDRGFPRQFIMVEELSQEILEAEKKAYGKVIRMMAHEVNNTIGPVNSIIHSALNAPALRDGQADPMLSEALEVALERNRQLNQFMRNFADVVRLPELNKKDLDLHELIRQVTTLMKPKAEGQGIRFELELAAAPVHILADEQQMMQVLINIMKNAMESIESDGVVRFTTSAEPKMLRITDTGKGIDAEQTRMLFSPFFSTKRTGQGIGLTLVKEILLNHRFAFSLRTVEPGRTEFEILMSTSPE